MAMIWADLAEGTMENGCRDDAEERRKAEEERKRRKETLNFIRARCVF